LATLPQLYTDLAEWWPLVSHPDEYDGEAVFIHRTLSNALGRPPQNILELGSGGGNTASHLARRARMTLVDLSSEMLTVSRRINPDAEHIEGDMRNVRLGRTFDAVLIHDAVMYMTDDDDLQSALATARAHLATNGAMIVLPDYVAESFKPRTDVGGRDSSDGSGRGLRYIEWLHAPMHGATCHTVDYVLLLRAADGTVEVRHDRHTVGLFTRDAWCDAFMRAGFSAPDVINDPWQRVVFVAKTAQR
jgi:SAM-dependent methyltransferase